ncbi:MAG: rane-associated zinc metalloprotease [Patescibacteria group bacterium]|nr:rane-associated zinc metalloprotease [Patescibacteria group bacterium]
MSIIIFIIILGVLVFVHELGHFAMAKLFGIRVDEFGMGFPPRAARLFKNGETEYTLNWIPFGGFVKIHGEDSLHIDDPDYHRSLVSKPWWKQIIVLIAGVTMNVILAWFLFSISFMIGAPTTASSVNNSGDLKNAQLTVVQIEQKSPADVAGLKAGDRITGVSRPDAILANPTADGFVSFIQSTKPGDTDQIQITRSGKIETISVTPNATTVPGTQAIGAGIDLVGTYRTGFFKSIGDGIKTTYYTAGQTLHSFGQLISGKSSIKTLTGPVGLVGVTRDAQRIGFVSVLMLAAVISINLAIINLVPFPALDGGRILFAIIEAIIRRPLPKKFVEWTNTIGFFLLIALMIIVTVKDVIHLF